MDDQRFKELVLEEIEEARAFRKKLKVAFQDAFLHSFGVRSIDEKLLPEQWKDKLQEEKPYTQEIGSRRL